MSSCTRRDAVGNECEVHGSELAAARIGLGDGRGGNLIEVSPWE